MTPVFVFDHPLFQEHDTGPHHPESAERLQAILQGIDRRGLKERLEWVKPSPVDEKHLLRVHTAEHVERLLVLRGRQDLVDLDTVVSSSSVEAAMIAAGSGIEAVDRVLKNPGSTAFCLCRPPGHHAEANVAMGFCLFNTVAVAAAYAIAEKKLKRVLVFDPDVHHGNGVQNIFYQRGDVFYVSIHQAPLYPGTGDAAETGAGKGEGRTINIPFPPGMGDADYCFATEKILLPAIRSFEPELVLFSAGFDAHEKDPLGEMKLTSNGFLAMYSLILNELAEKRIPAVFCLEGGYSLRALEEVVPALLERLLQEGAAPACDLGPVNPAARKIVNEVLAHRRRGETEKPIRGKK